MGGAPVRRRSPCQTVRVSLSRHARVFFAFCVDDSYAMSQISVVHYTGSPTKVLQHGGDRPVIVLRQPSAQVKDGGDGPLSRKNQRENSGGKTGLKVVPPMAVARRNARERNRVKQVNNGFANLRQHIPNFIAQAFEGAGRNKKLSKVETLRMAVEYIRSLEDVLETNGVSQPDHNSSLTSPNNSHTTAQFSFEDDDSISTTSTPPPQQLIRINTSDNTYEIISNNVFENGENLDPVAMQNLAVDGFEFNQDLPYFNVDNTTGSLSPGMYSEDSLSPNVADKKDGVGFVSVFDTDRLSPNINVEIKSEISDHPVLSLKSENELPETQKDLVDDVIDWWETQPQYSGAS